MGVSLVSWTAKVGIKALTLGAIKDSDLEDLKDVQGDVSSGAGGVIGEFIKERLRSNSQDRDTIVAFRELLSEMPEKLKGSKESPLVIIIDELDRCKPSYAVEVIEQIKHLFSVNNIVFILVMNRPQLEESVKHVYGPSIDAKTYLQKFINVETQLPKRTSDKYYNDVRDYIQRLRDLHQIEMWDAEDTLFQFFEHVAIHRALSLRELERVITNIAVLYAVSDKDHFSLSPLVVFLACVKVEDPGLYLALHNNEITYDEVVEKFNLIDLSSKTDEEQQTFGWFLGWLQFCLFTQDEYDNSTEKQELDNIRNSLARYHFARSDIIPMHTRRMSLFAVRLSRDFYS